MGEPITVEALDLVPSGGVSRFESGRGGPQALSGPLARLGTALARLGFDVDQAGSVHARIVAVLVAAEKAGAAQGPSSALRRKCAEYTAYLSAKLAEHRLPPLARLGDGLPEPLSPDARRTMLDVTREILGHLDNHIREQPEPAIPPPATPGERRPPASDGPIRFGGSQDDSGKTRRYMYVGKETALVEMHADFSLFLNLRDMSLVPTLLQTGWWEPWIDQMLRSLLSPGMSYVNAGANVGYHTCLGAKLVESTGRVFSFEANPKIFALLRRSVFHNGFSGRTSLFQAAVAAETGSHTFHFVEEQIGGGGLFEPPVFKTGLDTGREADTFAYDASDYTTIEVPCLTLDETVGREIASLDLLHMDIEGAEGPALLGARDMVARSRHVKLMLEWSVGGRSDETLKDQYRQAAAFLGQEGFHLYRIRPPAGNVFSTPPDLDRVDIADLLGLPHSDLFAIRP